MYKFTKTDVDNALIRFCKKGYQYTREPGEYYLKDIPVKMIYEHILFDKSGKDTNYDGTKSGEIQKRLKSLGYTLVKKGKAKTEGKSVTKKNDAQSSPAKILCNPENVLRNLIEKNQKLWIVGTGISEEGTETGHYYSGKGNQFWKLLYQTGITKRQYTYHADVKLCELSIGLTDLFPYQKGADKNLELSDFKADVDIFINDVKELKPKLILFNSKFSSLKCKKALIKYLEDALGCCGYEGNKNYFICYSSSGSVNGHTSDRLSEWQRVADIYNNLK